MNRYLLLSLLLAVLATAFIKADTYTLTGKVLDEKGTPLAGAVVKIKGTKIATVTDATGAFRLSNITGRETLVVSYVAYQEQTIRVNKKKTLQVTLAPSAEALEEVVVTGYAQPQASRKSYSGAAAKMDVSGLYYSPPPGVPGNAARVSVRGMASGAAAAVNNEYKADYYNQRSDTHNTEGYDAITDNPFLKAGENPLSTFSIDVDHAAYSNMRRFLKNGLLPPAGAVRIEEMINYFKYDYPQPQGNAPFTVNLEASDCPWNPSHQLVLIGIQGKQLATASLPHSNLVFLIDVSGSMQDPNKLPLVKSSLKLLVDQLRPEDKVAMVVYAGSAGLVLPSTAGNQKARILSAIDELEAGGSTAGGDGIRLAYKVAKDNFRKEGNNRVILCTDGDFNVGTSSDDELVRLIEAERKSGVFLTVLGYGMGNYQDAKMQKLADKGNGNHAYIDDLREAKKVLVTEAGGTLHTIAKDIKLQVEFNPAKVQGYRLIGYENRLLAKEDFNDDTKDAGELGSGHTVTALYEIIPVGVKAPELRGVDSLRYQATEQPFSEKSFNDELMYVKLRYKEPAGDQSRLVSFPLQDALLPARRTSNNFRFAASVAAFGMLLRESPYKGETSFESVLQWAEQSRGRDAEGYRKEFIELLQKAADIKEGL